MERPRWIRKKLYSAPLKVCIDNHVLIVLNNSQDDTGVFRIFCHDIGIQPGTPISIQILNFFYYIYFRRDKRSRCAHRQRLHERAA